MDIKSEGPVFPPVPLFRGRSREAEGRKVRGLADSGEPRCEMCGHEVIATAETARDKLLAIVSGIVDEEFGNTNQR